MPTSTLAEYMSTHATLVKVVIGCSLPLLVIASLLLCFISRSLKQLKKEEALADLEIQQAAVHAHDPAVSEFGSHDTLKMDERCISSASTATAVGTPPLKSTSPKELDAVGDTKVEYPVNNETAKLVSFTFPSLPAKPRPAFISSPEASRVSLSWWEMADVAVDAYPQTPSPIPHSTVATTGSHCRPNPAPPLYHDVIVPYAQQRQISGREGSTAPGFQKLETMPPINGNLSPPTPPTTQRKPLRPLETCRPNSNVSSSSGVVSPVSSDFQTPTSVYFSINEPETPCESLDSLDFAYALPALMTPPTTPPLSVNKKSTVHEPPEPTLPFPSLSSTQLPSSIPSYASAQFHSALSSQSSLFAGTTRLNRSVSTPSNVAPLRIAKSKSVKSLRSCKENVESRPSQIPRIRRSSEASSVHAMPCSPALDFETKKRIGDEIGKTVLSLRNASPSPKKSRSALANGVSATSIPASSTRPRLASKLSSESILKAKGKIIVEEVKVSKRDRVTVMVFPPSPPTSPVTPQRIKTASVC
ncbi:hypothetical protein CYLTODRAFT_55068 [Cylindrobasidium torrendii FP15055 ss-10]|uniref:Uncharacterized protein n=1 Tax=Cylindrobasidium torrendii FP15055 ss-10 TaxID=1314674 RepID=A0A0D7BRL8_9AGAR|nr:hypothetical protein CYLTODRAFT_55068 [Cylindrobasidium torrendii FP15055 ss-10]